MKAFLVAAVCFLYLSGPAAQAQEVYGQPDAPVVAEVLGTKIHASDPEEVKYVILSRLLDRYAAENDIEVQQDEIDAYVEAVGRAMEEDRNKREARRDDIARQLETHSLADTERQALSSEIGMLNDLLNSDSRTDSAEDKAAREQVATAFIRQWKIDRQLYQQYGGRIIFQQGGPEPLDAYRQFLEEQERKGAFRIVDKSFEPAFWRYYRTDSIHSFYPPGSAEEARALAIPWWQQDEAESAP